MHAQIETRQMQSRIRIEKYFRRVARVESDFHRRFYLGIINQHRQIVHLSRDLLAKSLKHIRGKSLPF
jgi:hypothetical protein